MRSHGDRTGLVLLALFCATFGGCASKYSGYHAFRPRPFEVDVPSPGGEATIARAVVAVLGLRKADKELGLPEELHFRLRLENLSTEPIALEPDRLSLLSADLQELARPRLEIAPSLEVPSGAEATFDLFFAAPAGKELDDLDLSGLNLQFGVRYRAAVMLVSATFERLQEVYYDPYWGPYPYARLYYGVSIHG